jgi:hypothetical protein
MSGGVRNELREGAAPPESASPGGAPTVSVATNKIVADLPALEIVE